MEITEVIIANGHENVLSTNKTTLEITKETHLTKKGNCILAVSANKGLADLTSEFKEALRKDNARLTVTIETGNIIEIVKASGNPQLILTHPTDVVIRKSSYICDRTLAIQADKAAVDVSRKLVEKLTNPEQEAKITLTVNV
jgi:hypothetical protein